MGLREILHLAPQGATVPDAHRFTEEQLKQASQVKAGHDLADHLDRVNPVKIKDLFTQQNVPGIQRLIAALGSTAVESVAVAFDYEAQIINQETTTYQAWLMAQQKSTQPDP